MTANQRDVTDDVANSFSERRDSATDKDLNSKTNNDDKVVVQLDTSIKTTDATTDEETPQPTEGGWGWAAVVGCVLMQLCSGSLSRIFGILLVAFQERFTESSTVTLTSANGLGIAMTMFTGPITTILMNKGVTARWILILSGFVAALGALLTAFVKAAWLLFLTFGILVGTGVGLAYTAGMVAIGLYFERRRPLAYGLMYLGNAASGMILGPFFTFSLRELFYRGTWLIYAGVMLQMIVAGMLVRPLNGRPSKRRHSNQMTEKSEERREDNVEKQDKLPHSGINHPKASEGVVAGIRLSLLADPVFLFFSVAYAIGCPCIYGQWAYLPSLVLESGLTKADAATLVFINSAAAPIGIIIFTLVAGADRVRPHLPRFALGVLSLTAVVDLLCSFFTSFIGFAFYAASSGFLGITYQLLRSVSLQDMMGRDDLPSVYGIFNFLMGIGIVIVPVLTGSLVDYSKTFRAPFRFFAASQVLATASLAISVLIFTSRKRYSAPPVSRDDAKDVETPRKKSEGA